MTIRAFEGRVPELGEGAWVDPRALVIGAVRMGAGSSVWPMTVIRGDIHWIEIGTETNIQDGCVLHVTHPSPFVPEGYPLWIGDRVTVGHGALLHGCRIESDCLIGLGARLLDGACIQSFTLVAAGALIPPGAQIEGGWVWMGAPARPTRRLTEKERERIGYSARHYRELAERHRRGLTAITQDSS